MNDPQGSDTWAADLARWLEEAGGPMTPDEEAWADSVLGCSPGEVGRHRQEPMSDHPECMVCHQRWPCPDSEQPAIAALDFAREAAAAGRSWVEADTDGVTWLCHPDGTRTRA